MPTTILNKDTKTLRKNQHHPKYNVILHNDDVNDMLHVMQALCTVLVINEETAYNFMIEAHTTGKSIVKTCELEHAEFYKQGLQDKGLTTTIEEA